MVNFFQPQTCSFELFKAETPRLVIILDYFLDRLKKVQSLQELISSWFGWESTLLTTRKLPLVVLLFQTIEHLK